MRQAKVLVSVMGDETQQRLSLHGLRSAAGFLQSKISERIDTRYIPRLEFELDQGVKKSIAVAEILKRVLPPAAPSADDEEAAVEDLAEEGLATDEEESAEDGFAEDGGADVPPDTQRPPD
jgi:ribosome-binding factor A